MKQTLPGAGVAIFACIASLHLSLARVTNERSPGGPPPTFPCQDCGTVFSLDPTTGAEKAIHSFENDGVDGYYPNADLTELDGRLYGTTAFGGTGTSCSDGCGTIYFIDLKTGAEKVLYSFLGGADGSGPAGGLHAVGDMFYGTTNSGGKDDVGTVFSFDPATRMETVIYAFKKNGQDGQYPGASLIDFKGILYGTTTKGGTHRGGTVVAVDPASGAETILHSFGGGQDGYNPETDVTGIGNVLYGTTDSGGTAGGGTVFSLDLATGAEEIVHSFMGGEDGDGPAGGLIHDTAKLYGTTDGGVDCSHGNTGQGTIYAIDISSGAEIVLHCFSTERRDAARDPFGSLIRDKLFYGTTSGGGSSTNCQGNGCGTIFTMTKYGHITTLYSFCSQLNCPDGAVPIGGMIDFGGVLYGVTLEGGADGAVRGSRPKGSPPR